MPRSRTKSWRAFDPVAHAASVAAARAAGGAAVTGAPVSARAAEGANGARRAVPQPSIRIAPAVKVRILGIDPGSRRMGFGVIECKGTNSAQLAHGCVTTGTGSLSDRLRLIFEGVNALIEQYSPDEVAIERVFLNRNVDSALKLGQARGAALCAVPRTVPVFEYAPRAIKLAVVGFGAAEKEQVAHMIRTLLGLEGRIQADASDALAIALCHAHSRRMQMLSAIR
jgi:crossover junction endodeoxyribonuclease RuvC